MDSGSVRDQLGENWRKVDTALRYGLRGLGGGSSLARLLAQHRSVRNLQELPPLSIRHILAWSDPPARCTRTNHTLHADQSPANAAAAALIPSLGSKQCFQECV
jgi:hypothetical protein